jgi:hypothetical protein
VEEWIRWIYSHMFYLRFVKQPEHAVLVVRGDGFSIARKHGSMLIVTLLNFGMLSKCKSFNFIINLAEVSTSTKKKPKAERFLSYR